MTTSEIPDVGLTPVVAWSQRVRKVGGFIQLAFAVFWLVRGANSVGGGVGTSLGFAALVAGAAALAYAVVSTRGIGGRPTSKPAKRIERSVTAATIIELVGSVVLPIVVIATGHSDWVLPSIAITIGPLLLWLGHLVDIPRYRPIGWILTVGPVLLVAGLSGTALEATTGLSAGILLLATSTAGFRDLSNLRRVRT